MRGFGACLLTLGVLLSSTPVTAAPYAYVLSGIPFRGTGRLAVVDVATRAVVASVPLPAGDEPSGHAAIEPGGRRVYLSLHSEGGHIGENVLTFDSVTRRFTGRLVLSGFSPTGMAFAPDGTRIYVANSSGDEVFVVDAASEAPIARIAVETRPTGLAVSPDGTRVYVANSCGGTVSGSCSVTSVDTLSVIDAITLQVVATLSGPPNPRTIATSPDGQYVYVGARGGEVWILDTATNGLVGTVPVGGINISGLVLSPSGNRLYVSIESVGLAVIDTDSRSVVATLFDGVTDGGVSLTPDGSQLYVTRVSQTTTSVRVVDTASLGLVGEIIVGGQGPLTVGSFITPACAGAGQCDDGDPVTIDTCTAATGCKHDRCGNGQVDVGEPCDDDNLIDGDGCDSNCTPTGCGNGVVTAGEACDDNNLIDDDGCSSDCRAEACGNGDVTPNEGCDDGNLVDGDGCDSNCRPTGCGSGVVTGGEQCDDGNLVDGDGCDSDCTVGCGNGRRTPNEGCDDSNLVDGDGCSAGCGVESGWVCTDAPSRCSFLADCGNGILDLNETCDNGAEVPDDCCSSICRFELANVMCRPGADLCDAPELCTATTATCPADVLRAAGTECRAPTAPCDQPESCDGFRSACPDELTTPEPAGTLCRPAACAGDTPEFCGGLDTSCPADVTVCRVFDLEADWSSTDNPNGPWRYRAGTQRLGHVNDTPLDQFPGGQPGWGSSLPFWFKSTVLPVNNIGFPPDWQIGDVVVHADYPGEPPANVTWTSPTSGLATITGAAWIGREIGRRNRWSILRNGVLLTQGEVYDGDPYSRANPFDFSAGTGGPSVLRSVAANRGDVIELRTEGVGTPDYNAFRLRIAVGAPACGDGIVTLPEGCDDGNNAPGDGCSATCATEPGKICTGEPSRCSDLADCGDGASQAGEQCDDGNNVAADCCSPTCALEPAGTVCRPGADACDSSETCTGTCPPDSLAPSSQVCRPAVDACDVAERCSGGSAECPADSVALAGTVCRPAVCNGDTAELCDGTGTSCPADTSAACTQWDLTSDWSSTANPNGPWRYRADEDLLDGVDDTPLDDFPGGQAGWGPYLPFWFRSDVIPVRNIGFPPDWEVGDVVVHTTSGRKAANVSWTSPLGGLVQITGAVWMGREIDRASDWRLLKNGVALTGGALSSGDAFSRATPFDFALGSGGPGVLTDLPVEIGDVIELELASTEVGDYVGVRMTISAAPPVCGDGRRGLSEECDDGNTTAGDGCNAGCQIEAGYLCSGEPSACSLAAFCGNGATAGGEECDDGNSVQGDGCDNDCTRSRCGNGIAAGAEQCDDGNLLDGDACDSNCTLPRCGNGIVVVAAGEQCDDGNLIDGDGCDSDCTLTACGNGIATPNTGEECDDGNAIDSDACTNSCTAATCGDGAVASGSEQCDDGNLVRTDGCKNDCTLPACGDGSVQTGEQCDDGNAVATDGCDACAVQPGFLCKGAEPTRCSSELDCGNGTANAGEECDDGNTTPGDGCDASCGLEELALSGSWQLTVHCGPPEAEEITTARVAIAQAAGSSALALSTTGCPTVFADGAIRVSSSCTTAPDPVAGTVSGTAFTSPLAGSASTAVTLAAPYSSPEYGCLAPQLLERLEVPSRLVGTVVEAGSGRGAKITGSYEQGTVQAFDTLGAACASQPAETCSFTLLRDEAPAGADVVVEPLEDAVVSFSEVDQPGSTTVAPLSEPEGEVPPNFQLLDTAIFYDVKTDATLPPGVEIEVCLPYPDDDDDGFVDGTTPPIDERTLRILHDEGGTFVDRTAHRYPVSNQICAAVEHLSQFTLAASACPATPLPGCRGAGRSSLKLIEGSKDAGDRLIWKWAKGQATSQGEFGDPTADSDYAVCLYTGAPATLAGGVHVPAGGGTWAALGTRGYRYKDKAARHGGVSEILVSAGGAGKAAAQVKGKGAALLDLARPLATPVTVQLVNLERRACWAASYPAASVKKNDLKQLEASTKGP